METPRISQIVSRLDTEDKNTPASTKRKADKTAEAVRKTDPKKAKATYTPKSQAARTLRKTPRECLTTKERMEINTELADKSVRVSELKGYFEDLGKSLSSSLTASLTKDFTEAMGVVGERVKSNAENISKIQLTIKRIEEDTSMNGKALEKKLERLESVVLASRLSDSRSRVGSQSGPDLRVDLDIRADNIDNSGRYSTARRALRLWPVPGEGEDELRSEAVRFIRDKMRVPNKEVEDDKIVLVRRTKQARRSSANHEVLVIFSDKFARDVVMTHSKNLAPFNSPESGPTAGTRFEYPPHLGNDFRTLNWYGSEMRKRHGLGTRRNVKFDDEDESIFLDICLPGEDAWHRVSPMMARKYRDQVDKERMEASKKKLEGPTNNNPILRNPVTQQSIRPGRSTANLGWGGDNAAGPSTQYRLPKRFD